MTTNFEGAALTRLTEDIPRTPVTTNQDVRLALHSLLARARWLVKNDPHVAGAVNWRFPANIIGHRGVRLVCRVKSRNGRVNETLNRRVEEAWKRWTESKLCTKARRFDFVQVQHLLLSSVIRDGEALVELIPDRGANESNFSIHIVPIEMLDATYDYGTPPAGIRVHQGVEVGLYGEPIAYHLRPTVSPFDLDYPRLGYQRVRMPADRAIHAFRAFDANQWRGVTWLHAIVKTGAFLERYREAELIAARMGASKVIAMHTTDDSPASLVAGLQTVRGKDGRERYVLEDQVEPGQTFAAPPGWQAQMLDPTHPNSNYADYEKALLRAMASAMGVSYHSFSGDLSDVNYSAARQGAMDEREVYRAVQEWFISTVIRPIFERWALYAATSGLFGSRSGVLDAVLESSVFQARGFGYVDPGRESTAQIAQLQAGLTSRTRILRMQGVDIADVANELREEAVLLADLQLGQPAASGSDSPEAEPEPSEDDDAGDVSSGGDADDDQEDDAGDE